MIRRISAFARVHALDIFSSVQGAAVFPPVVRRLLLRMAGYRVGPGARINQGVYIGSRDIVFGADILVGARCHLGGGGRLVLGDRVTLSANVTLTTSTHQIGGPDRRCGDHYSADITVEPGCWIGVGATILPGVTVGAGSVVAAGSVVTRSLSPNAVYAGAPARWMRGLSSAPDAARAGLAAENLG